MDILKSCQPPGIKRRLPSEIPRRSHEQYAAVVPAITRGNPRARPKLPMSTAPRMGSAVEDAATTTGKSSGVQAGHVSRLRFILRARELGFSIEQIRGLLDLVDGGTQTCAEVKERTELHLADVRAKIADLKRIEKVLAETSKRCSGEDVPECPVLEALAS